MDDKFPAVSLEMDNAVVVAVGTAVDTGVVFQVVSVVHLLVVLEKLVSVVDTVDSGTHVVSAVVVYILFDLGKLAVVSVVDSGTHFVAAAVVYKLFAVGQVAAVAVVFDSGTNVVVVAAAVVCILFDLCEHFVAVVHNVVAAAVVYKLSDLGKLVVAVVHNVAVAVHILFDLRQFSAAVGKPFALVEQAVETPLFVS